MKLTTQTDRELLRDALLAYLAPRFRQAYSAEALVRHLAARGLMDVPIDAEDVEQAALVLRDNNLVREIQERLGATVYYQVTGGGVVMYERSSGLKIR